MFVYLILGDVHKLLTVHREYLSKYQKAWHVLRFPVCTTLDFCMTFSFQTKLLASTKLFANAGFPQKARYSYFWL